MSSPTSPLPAELAPLLQAERLFGELQIEDQVLSGVLDHEHPMAWRHLGDLAALEALTLVAPSPAALEALPDWRDAGWSVEPLAGPALEGLTLWWHAATQQAMLASQIPLTELRPDAVAHTLRLHREGIGSCRERAAAQAAPPAATAAGLPVPAPGLCFG